MKPYNAHLLIHKMKPAIHSGLQTSWLEGPWLWTVSEKWNVEEQQESSLLPEGALLDTNFGACPLPYLFFL